MFSLIVLLVHSYLTWGRDCAVFLPKAGAAVKPYTPVIPAHGDF